MAESKWPGNMENSSDVVLTTHITQLKGWHCEQLWPSSFKGTREQLTLPQMQPTDSIRHHASVARHTASLEIKKNVKNKKTVVIIRAYLLEIKIIEINMNF